ncbi:MAG TPA: acylphosphatase, partial [Nitrospira sp.]|nr:acylphosphatase [Nitrospira sp.]
MVRVVLRRYALVSIHLRGRCSTHVRVRTIHRIDFRRRNANHVTRFSRCETIPSLRVSRGLSMTDASDSTAVRARISVSGRVQGVGYRAFTVRNAVQRELVGGVKNCEDGRV